MVHVRHEFPTAGRAVLRARLEGAEIHPTVRAADGESVEFTIGKAD